MSFDKERISLTVRIEDYGLIGDCEAAALVGRNGSIDWLCLPRFDSGSCFAALLGKPENGRWQIALKEAAKVTDRRNRDRTLILETTFETEEGRIVLIDFMPPKGEASDVVRIVVGIEGRVRMRSEPVIRFDYGRTVPRVSRLQNGALRAIAGPNMLVLSTPVAHHGEDMKTVGEFTVDVDEKVPFVLTHALSYSPVPKSPPPKNRFEIMSVSFGKKPVVLKAETRSVARGRRRIECQERKSRCADEDQS